MPIRNDHPQVVDGGIFWEAMTSYMNNKYIMQRNTAWPPVWAYKYRIITSGLNGSKTLEATAGNEAEIKGYWDLLNNRN